MRRFDHLIVGGGLAAVSAAEGIRERDPECSVAILGDEEEPPYHRPPLSKEYLQAPGAGRELLHVKPEGWFEEHGVELLTGRRAVALEPREPAVTTAAGETYGGRRLLLATGGRPRELPLPGAELDGVVMLRTVEHAEAIREAAAEADRALLVGAGFIGMELASSLSSLEVRSVVVELGDRVWAGLLPPALGAAFRARYEARGVEFRLGTSVAELRGRGGRLVAAVLEGGEEIACDLAVVGVGIEPEVGLAVDAGLAVKDGVVVDAYGRTSHASIYAAGDVARFPDPVFGDSARVEHWDHARAHGRLVGRNMAGDRERYDHLSYFFSEAFDWSLHAFGRPAEADRTLMRGSPDGEEWVALCVREGRLHGAILANANHAMDECRELVRRRAPASELDGEPLEPGALGGTRRGGRM